MPAAIIRSQSPPPPASRMPTVHWYEVNKQVQRDKQRAEDAELVYQAALAEWQRPRASRPGLLDNPKETHGFFTPELNSRLQRVHSRLVPSRQRFEPLKKHSGKGGGVSMSDFRARSAAQLASISGLDVQGRWAPRTFEEVGLGSLDAPQPARRLQRSASHPAFRVAPTPKLEGIQPLRPVPTNNSLVPGAWHHNFPRLGNQRYLRSAGLAPLTATTTTTTTTFVLTRNM